MSTPKFLLTTVNPYHNFFATEPSAALKYEIYFLISDRPKMAQHLYAFMTFYDQIYYAFMTFYDRKNVDYMGVYDPEKQIYKLRLRRYFYL